MKSRYQQLYEKSVSAMMSAIEIYNKPDFKYREETFAILAINSWELLLKSKWLKDNKNMINSLYVRESKKTKNGKPSKKKYIKKTKSGNPFTYSLLFLAEKLNANKHLDKTVYDNILALCEIRDSAVHFYNDSIGFAVRLQEIGSASVKNYVKIIKLWFNESLSNYNFYLIPLIHATFEPDDIIKINKEENNVLMFLNNLENNNNNQESGFSLSVGVEVNFTRSKANDALNVRFSNEPNAIKIKLSEKEIKDKYPMEYKELVEECRNKYTNFKLDKKFFDIKSECEKDDKYCHIRLLNPSNPKGGSKNFIQKQSLII